MTTNTETLTQPQSKHASISLGTIVLFFGLALVSVVVLLALIRQQRTQPTSGPAPDFTLTTLSGDTLKLSDFRGSVVVVNFWASWCAPCRIEAPELQAAYDAYKDRGVVFIGVAWSDLEKPAREYLLQYGITYINGLDLGTRISELYAITGVPETFIVDANGNVVQFFYAQLTRDQLGSAIDRALQVGG